MKLLNYQNVYYIEARSTRITVKLFSLGLKTKKRILRLNLKTKMLEVVISKFIINDIVYSKFEPFEHDKNIDMICFKLNNRDMVDSFSDLLFDSFRNYANSVLTTAST